MDENKQPRKYEDKCTGGKEKQNRYCIGDRTKQNMLKNSKKGCYS